MKWYENGIMFEGTPAEFHALHPEIARKNPKSPVTVFPESTQTAAKLPGDKHGRTRLRVDAILSGGRELHFQSVAAAFRWYENACPGRKHLKYIQFWNALKSEPICFADAEMKLAGGR